MKTAIYLLLNMALLMPVFVFADIVPRIVGGSEANPDAYSFMAMIWFDDDGDGNGEPACAGTYIGDRWILTAAHCFTDENALVGQAPSRLVVLAGQNSLLSSDNTFIGVERLILHPEFDVVTRRADIALIEMSEGYTGMPITLPSSSSNPYSVGDPATVLGWGRTSESGDSSLLLREVTLPIRSNVVCPIVLGDSFDTDASLCAGGEPDGLRDSCNGDSGGPLFVDRDGLSVQIGIVNFGIGCARAGVPALYTRLTHYVDWVVAMTNADFPVQYSGVQEQSIEWPMLTDAVPIDGAVQLSQKDVYLVPSTATIDLTTKSGDADLYIFQGNDLESAELLFKSIKPADESSVDRCQTEATGVPVFAVVFGFEESTYSISAESESLVGDTSGTGGSGGSGSVGWGSLVLIVLVGIRRSRLGVLRHLEPDNCV